MNKRIDSLLKNKKAYMYIIAVIIILFYLPCFMYSNIQDGDEWPSIAAVMKLAGIDWSGSMAAYGIWHGYGHIFFLAPIIALCKTWVQMYALIRVYSLIIWIIIGELVFILLDELGMDLNSSFVISIISALGILKPDYGLGLSAMTEEYLGLIQVIVAFLFVKQAKISNVIRKSIMIGVIWFLLAYTLTIHSRAIILIVGFGCVYFIYLIMNFGKWVYSSLIASSCGLALGMTVYKLFNSWYKQAVMTNASGGTGRMQNNASNVLAYSTKNLYLTFQGRGEVSRIGELFLSLLSGYSLVTFGLFTVCVVSVFTCFYDAIKKKMKLSPLMVASAWGLLCFFGMNFAYSLKNYIDIPGKGRLYLYLRYAIPFCILPIVFGCMCFLQLKNYRKYIICISIGINLFLMKSFFLDVIPVLKSSNMTALASIYRLYLYNGETPRVYFGRLLALLLVVCMGIIVLRKKYQIIFMVLVYLVSSAIFWGSAISKHVEKTSIVANAINMSNIVVSWAHNKNINVYCYTEQSSAPSYPRFLVTMNPRENINPISEIENIDAINGILLSDYDGLELDNGSFFKIVLDDNEFLYATSIDLLDEWLKYYQIIG
ncbi:hypothetical protein [Butyrivibrio sp. YAB3001]|uniref:hypothetical protein n=1 Tax=Butyrivibrio sp. YAB3001 TaxID=1520812 RepID=UPI0008F6643C|nr:hypothetical protein [Butyrivibrio sp. YAB3001]SFD00311.1 hypothetical protein SAMN02910398_03754 [Butyrivibrio sp. YAB3001]